MMMPEFTIPSLSPDWQKILQQKLDEKTKPIGSLGKLEKIAVQLGAIQRTLTPTLTHPTIVLFAADHGIVAEGVSPYPQAVTHQMVSNFLAGGAAINVIARQNGLNVVVVDAGVNHEFPKTADLIHAKIGYGTANMLHGPAMSAKQAERAIVEGASVVRKLHASGCNVIGFGEMGIGNTSASALLMSTLCHISLDYCVGRGTGLDDEGLQHKLLVLTRVLNFHRQRWPQNPTPLDILTAVGGFEIAQMVGAFCQAAASGMAILVDGFIATAAFLVAERLYPAIREYAFFAHQSDEQGHRLMLETLGADPLVNLGMRLGEGTGAAVAYPLLKTAVACLNEMASFESAGVSQKESIE